MGIRAVYRSHIDYTKSPTLLFKDVPPCSVYPQGGAISKTTLRRVYNHSPSPFKLIQLYQISRKTSLHELRPLRHDLATSSLSP